MLAFVPALILASSLSIGAVEVPTEQEGSFEDIVNNEYTIVVSDISELNAD